MGQYMYINLILSLSLVPPILLYKLIKAEAEEMINILEAKISSYTISVRNIDEILNNATSVLSSPDMLYEAGDIANKRNIKFRKVNDEKHLTAERKVRLSYNSYHLLEGHLKFVYTVNYWVNIKNRIIQS